MPRFEDSAALAAEGAHGGQREQDWHQHCGAAERARQAVAPPGDEPSLVAAAPDDVGAQQGEEDEYDAQKFAAESWRAGKFRQ